MILIYIGGGNEVDCEYAFKLQLQLGDMVYCQREINICGTVMYNISTLNREDISYTLSKPMYFTSNIFTPFILDVPETIKS